MTHYAFHRLPEAAHLLSQAWGIEVPAETLRLWVRQGRVPAIRTPGGRILIRRDVLSELSDKGAADAVHNPTRRGSVDPSEA